MFPRRYHWYDFSCDVAAYYVCENAVINDPCRSRTLNQTFFYNKVNTVKLILTKVKKNFTIFTNQLNWGASRAACKAKGMDLANPITQKEKLCLVNKIEQACNY